MKNIIHNTLLKLDGYLLSIQRNVETGQYELEIGLRNSWVYKSTTDIGCEVIHESDAGNIVKIFGNNEDITIDELIHFVEKIIDTNKKIAEMEEAFQNKMNEQKQILAEQIKEFQNQLDKVKEKSFDDDEEDSNDEKKLNEELSESEKEELIDKL